MDQNLEDHRFQYALLIWKNSNALLACPMLRMNFPSIFKGHQDQNSFFVVGKSVAPIFLPNFEKTIIFKGHLQLWNSIS